MSLCQQEQNDTPDELDEAARQGKEIRLDALERELRTLARISEIADDDPPRFSEDIGWMKPQPKISVEDEVDLQPNSAKVEVIQEPISVDDAESLPTASGVKQAPGEEGEKAKVNQKPDSGDCREEEASSSAEICRGSGGSDSMDFWDWDPGAEYDDFEDFDFDVEEGAKKAAEASKTKAVGAIGAGGGPTKPPAKKEDDGEKVEGAGASLAQEEVAHWVLTKHPFPPLSTPPSWMPPAMRSMSPPMLSTSPPPKRGTRDRCACGGISESELQKHLMKAHRYQCQGCKTFFPTKEDWDEAWSGPGGRNKPQDKCRICERTFQSRGWEELRRRHLQEFHGMGEAEVREIMSRPEWCRHIKMEYV